MTTDDQQELMEIRKLLDEKEYEKVINEAASFLLSDNTQTASDAAWLSGQAHFRLKSFEEAVGFLEKAVEVNGHSFDYLDIAIASVLAGRADNGKTALEKAIDLELNRDDGRLPETANIYFYYTCALMEVGKYKDVLEPLDRLRTFFEQIRISDHHYLFVNGFPQFFDTMRIAETVFRELGRDFDYKGWLEPFSILMDNEGRACIETMIKDLDRDIYGKADQTDTDR